MWFPVLFPTGQFGEHHPRQVKRVRQITVTQQTPTFQKRLSVCLFLLWQKEMRDISSGVYNLLKSTRRQPMSVSALLHSVEARHKHLEANLFTMLRSVTSSACCLPTVTALLTIAGCRRCCNPKPTSRKSIIPGRLMVKNTKSAKKMTNHS